MFLEDKFCHHCSDFRNHPQLPMVLNGTGVPTCGLFGVTGTFVKCFFFFFLPFPEEQR